MAPSVTTISCTNAVYTGAALETCTASVSGAGGLALPLDVTYGNNTNVGTATGHASYAGDANHSGSDADATFAITPATTTTVVTCPATVVYSGVAQTPCTANVTGAGGLNQAVTPVTYEANLNAGTATATATYDGDPNHTGSTGSATFLFR